VDDDRGYALIDRIARLAGRLGMNETRVRWKLLRLREKRAEAADRARTASAHVAYEHAVCGQCGRILPRGTKACESCGARLEPRWVQMLRRAGLHAPVPLSVSTLIAVVILVAFARQFAAQPGFSFSGMPLLELGGHYPALEWVTGQWWRLGTAVLLHAGVIHVLFNLVALAQVGPDAEEAFGPGRVLLFFVVMGVVANLPTLLLHRDGLYLGASGAVLGLGGLAAGWGQRQGTSQGRAVRNSMLMWLAYATVFGLVMPGRIDHSAHVTGFAAGFVLGWASHGVRRRQGALDAAMGVVGLVLLLALLALILFPPDPRSLAPWFDA
jgi:rhomboid protease GluP